MKIEVIYEDGDLLVINKPAGVVVNNSQTTKTETIQQWFAAYLHQSVKQSIDQTQQWSALLPDEFDDSYGQPTEIFQQRGGIVHRLDKNTSGVLILAKNPGSLLNLMRQFKLRQTEKHYLALVHGFIKPRIGTIDAPLKRHFRLRQKMAVIIGGRQATTDYQREKIYQFNQEKLNQLIMKPSQLTKLLDISTYFSLVNARPRTGRMHQIRVHLAHLGYPLVADDKYVGRKRYKLDSLWCARHFLHAFSLKITHPRTNKVMTFTAPLATDLQASLDLLIETEA